MGDNGYKYIPKLTQFVTTLTSRRNCSMVLIPKIVKNSDVFSILYSKPLREFRKPKFENGERVRISKYDLPFRKGYRPQSTDESFRNCCSFFEETSIIHNTERTKLDYPR